MEYYRQRFIEELNEEGDIEVRGLTFLRHDVLQMDPDGYAAVFGDWVSQDKSSSINRAERFLRENRCFTRFQTLQRRIHQQAVLPWIGAGMSCSSGMPLWGNFLIQSCADGPELTEEIARLIQAGLYEDAAQRVSEFMTPNVLDEEIENVFGNRFPNVAGPVQLLPSLFSQGCVTTNFDYVLEEVYRASNHGDFNHQIVGDQLREAPRRYADDRHCLFRIHGAARQRAGRVLTRQEYDTVYRNDVLLADVLNSLVGQKSMFFLGCSLTVDRTLQALSDLKMQAGVQNSRHYALLPLPPTGDRHQRRLHLNAADIHPIWYPNDGEHDQHIEDILLALMEPPE